MAEHLVRRLDAVHHLSNVASLATQIAPASARKVARYVRPAAGKARRHLICPVPKLFAALICTRPAFGAGSQNCLAGHTKREKDCSLHFVYKFGLLEWDEPTASTRCTPSGRILVDTPSADDDGNGNFVPESLGLTSSGSTRAT